MEDSTPVAVELDGVLDAEVRAYVETELGWQVVTRGGGLPPAVALVTHPVPGTPCVVVVDGPQTVDEVRAALQAGALDVVSWPDDRDRLAAALGLAAGTGPSGAGGTPGTTAAMVVGGASGGVGTSTVTLAIAGLLAWSGAQVVVVGGDGMLRLAGLDPWEGPGALEIAGLDPVSAAQEVAGLARPVPAVPGLRLLGGGPVRQVSGWPADVVVVDAGAAAPEHLDIVCASPDAHLAAVADIATPVLLVGDGPLSDSQAAGVLGRRPAGRLAFSHRVARAGVAGRVPDGLPGRWLADLRAVLRDLS